MTPRAPRFAAWLMSRLTPADDADVVLGDLAEEFQKRATRDGLRSARRWYHEQSWRSVIPTLARRWFPTPLTPPEKGPLVRTFGDGLLQDLRFSLRMARRKPLVTAVSVASLTVGIALTATVFTLINAALIRPLPVNAPSELAWITEQRTSSVNITLPWPDFVDLRRDQQVFTDMTAVTVGQFSLRREQQQLLADGEFVSDSYFGLLGLTTRAGRAFGDTGNAADSTVAVVSTRLWRELAGNQDFSPVSLHINERPFTIVGLIDAQFGGVVSGRRADIWVPLSQFPSLTRQGPERFTERRMSWLLWFGRLKPGASLQTAAADLNRIESALAPTVGRSQPKIFRVTDGSRGSTTGTEAMAPTLRLLFVAAVVVMLVACANAANLLLARGAERRRELAVRTALGASRLRLIRLFLVEAGVIACTATLAAAGVAIGASRLTAPLLTAFGTPIALDLSLDWRTLAFLAGITILTTLLAGLAPAWSVVLHGHRAGDDGTRAATAGRRATRVRQGLLVLQFGCSVTLVVAAVLLFRTVDNLRAMPTGFDTDRVGLLTVSLRGAGFTPPQSMAYLHDMLGRLRATPGVEAVGFATTPPVGFGGSRRTVNIPGVTPADGSSEEVNYNQVSSGYLEAMGISLVAGRTFTEADDRDQRAVIVNETMARTFWPDGAVGRTMLLAEDQPPVEIVGVVKDAKYRTLREPAIPSFYLPMAASRSGEGTFHVRTSTAPDGRLDDLRRAMTTAYPAVPVTIARTLRSQTERNLSDDRLALSIGIALAIAALILAAAGLFGSMSYLVTQRTREIGVRVALGADARSVHTLVLSQGLRLAVVGSGIGLAGALWTSRAIEARLFGVTAMDPASFIVAAVVLTTVALVATWLPARRAARVDPIQALRDE